MKSIICLEKAWFFAVFILLVAASFPDPARAQCTLPATGQTQCYNNQGPVPCPAVGFPGQDAETAYNSFSYTLVTDIPGQETVVDDNTGLEWTQAAFPRMNWQQALQFCDTLQWGGYSDWRLPNAKELQSIVDYSRFNPSFDPIFAGPIWLFWTSTTSSFRVFTGLTENAADAIGFDTGSLGQLSKSYGCNVRPVRGCPGGLGCTLPATGQHSCFDNGSGVPCPVPGFPNQDAENIYNPMSYTLDATVPGQETIHDQVTGLEWSQYVWENVTWQQALQLADTLRWGGHDDWRMPNLKELQSLSLYQSSWEIDPIFGNIFPSFWSSTTYVESPISAWLHDYQDYAQYGPQWKTVSRALRTVRFCTGAPTQTEETSWGGIKKLFR